MNNRIFEYLSIVVFCLFFLACEKMDKSLKPPIGQEEIWNCHRDSKWDEIKIKNALIGVWKWEYVAFIWTPESDGYVTDQELTIEFKSDSSLIVKQHGQIIQSAEWLILGGDQDLFSVDEEPNVPQLFGNIILCNDIVEFNGTYADLSDNYFRKIE